jgi:hypothetical protein
MRRTTIAAITLTGIVAATGGWQLIHRHSTTKPLIQAAQRQGTVAERSVSAPTTTIAQAKVDHLIDASARGAVRAAVRFLELDERLFPGASPAEARALSDSITSASAQTRLGDRAETHQREILAKGNLEGLILRLAPISTRVRSQTSKSATVDIFLLRLWSFPAKGALDDYATAEVKLVFENGEWRLADSSVIDGPYPVARFSARPTLASTAARFEQILTGFNDQDLTP